jgi:hypothetical protein
LGGGGGGGNASYGKGQNGLPFTGGGGGGSDRADSGVTGAAGGSGIVIIRYPAYFAAAKTTTGSPLTYKTGFYRVYVFNASGTITF